jgi:pseudouridine synthase
LPERLQKYLAHAGVASRRASEQLILSGAVSVNGQVVKELGSKVDPEKDKIEVSGKEVSVQHQNVYLVLNKPRGVITSCHDPEGRSTVMDLVPACPGLHPVGRLDRNSEGLLLLTNDGEFTQLLTHPRHHVEKTYRVVVEGRLSSQAIAALRNGVSLEDGMTGPASVEGVDPEGDLTHFEITINEGRNRQIRRMCETVGNPVKRLKRIRIGMLGLKGLRPGEYRTLTLAEVRALREGR